MAQMKRMQRKDKGRTILISHSKFVAAQCGLSVIDAWPSHKADGLQGKPVDSSQAGNVCEVRLLVDSTLRDEFTYIPSLSMVIDKAKV